MAAVWYCFVTKDRTQTLHWTPPKTSTITVKRPVSPFPLVLDNSCCSQPSESSLQLFYTDTPNSSFHPFYTDSPIRPTISPTPFDSETELSSSLSTAFDAIGGSWETTVETANDGIFCSTPKPSAVRIHAKRRWLIDILPFELQCSLSDVDTSEAEILTSSTSGSASRSLSQMLGNSCCESRCLAHLSIVQVENAREKFQCRTTVEQNQFILDSFQVTGEKKISQTSAVMLEGQLICRDAFISTLEISRGIRICFANFLKECFVCFSTTSKTGSANVICAPNMVKKEWNLEELRPQLFRHSTNSISPLLSKWFCRASTCNDMSENCFALESLDFTKSYCRARA